MYITREEHFEQVKRIYDMGKFTNEEVKTLVHDPNHPGTLWLTKEEYKLITGEDWTPDTAE